MPEPEEPSLLADIKVLEDGALATRSPLKYSKALWSLGGVASPASRP